MEQGHVSIANKKIHFKVLGEGPPIVLLHPSPHNSIMMLPLAEELASHYTVFCMDTPGYGASDALESPPKDLSTYTEIMQGAFSALGLTSLSLYGSATGAQLAIRYALENPDEVNHIFLDNSAHFDDTLRSDILKHYFPDLTPQLDGQHLVRLWDIVSHLFLYFPWCFKSPEYALGREQLPAPVLHSIAMDFLRAGGTYDWAYKAAFEHERAVYVQQMRVPTTIFRWNNSIITKYVDDLLNFDFPSNVSAIKIDGDATERMKSMTQYINEKATGKVFSELPKTFQSTIKGDTIPYNFGNASLPVASADGKYLNMAWDMLIANNPSLNAHDIQSCLVDWFTKSN